MGKRMYVGNLSYQTTETDLTNLFEQVGPVESVNIITDRDTGRSKGFGFVEFTDNGQANAAMSALNGKEHNGRALTVNEARPRNEASGNRGGFGGGGGGRNRY